MTIAEAAPQAPPAARAAAATLWLALGAGPAAASLNLGIGYALVKWSCSIHGTWPLWSVAAACALIALAGAWMGVARLSDIGTPRETGQRWTRDSRRLLSTVAIALDLLLTLFIVATTLAMAVLSPCE